MVGLWWLFAVVANTVAGGDGAVACGNALNPGTHGVAYLTGNLRCTPTVFPALTLKTGTLDCRGFSLSSVGFQSGAVGVYLAGVQMEVRNCVFVEWGYHLSVGAAHMTHVTNTTFVGGHSAVRGLVSIQISIQGVQLRNVPLSLPLGSNLTARDVQVSMKGTGDKRPVGLSFYDGDVRHARIECDSPTVGCSGIVGSGSRVVVTDVELTCNPKCNHHGNLVMASTADECTFNKCHIRVSDVYGSGAGVEITSSYGDVDLVNVTLTDSALVMYPPPNPRGRAPTTIALVDVVVVRSNVSVTSGPDCTLFNVTRLLATDSPVDLAGNYMGFLHDSNVTGGSLVVRKIPTAAVNHSTYLEINNLTVTDVMVTTLVSSGNFSITNIQGYQTVKQTSRGRRGIEQGLFHASAARDRRINEYYIEERSKLHQSQQSDAPTVHHHHGGEDQSMDFIQNEASPKVEVKNAGGKFLVDMAQLYGVVLQLHGNGYARTVVVNPPPKGVFVPYGIMLNTTIGDSLYLEWTQCWSQQKACVAATAPNGTVAIANLIPPLPPTKPCCVDGLHSVVHVTYINETMYPCGPC